MARLRSLLLLFVVCCTLRAAGQSSGQYIITLMSGQSYVRMLPPDWRPRFEGAFLYFTPRDRVFAPDVAAIQPAYMDDVTAMREVKLLFRSHLGHGSQVFWVPSAIVHLEDAPRQNGFLVLGPQTLVRLGIYREVLE